MFDYKQSESDPIPTWLLIKNVLQFSFLYNYQHRQSLSQLRSIPSHSQTINHISPFEEVHFRYKDLLSNNRPISNFSVVSKIIERIVKSRLTDHPSSNNLLNPHQSHSLPTANTIPLKQLSRIFTMISSIQGGAEKKGPPSHCKYSEIP